MKFEDITSELMEKAKSCTTADELVALAKAEGMELTDEQLEDVAGGSWSGTTNTCNAFGCGGWDCSMFGCTTVECSKVDCAVF